MGVNVVKLANGETIVDMTGATITPETVMEGYMGYGANGEPVVGTATTAKHFAKNVTLPASGWMDNQQNVTVSGVLADNEKCTVIAGPDVGSAEEYLDCEVWCSAQGDGTLTFSCTYEPNVDLTANVAVFR